MGKTKYDPEMRMSEHGRRLYCHWKNKVHRGTDCPEFLTFIGFYNWAMENGYTVGARLCRYDRDEPFSPDNCFWVQSGEREYTREYTRMSTHKELEKQWDDTVNRIRLHYGMEPLHSLEV